jgi:Tfp pilus assembly protein PilO
LAVAGVYYAEGLIEEVEAQITQKKELIAVAEAKIEKIPSIEKEVIILRENLQEYVKILPDTKELTNFLRQLNQFERQSEIKSRTSRSSPRHPALRRVGSLRSSTRTR